MRCAPVCEVDCDKEDSLFSGCVGEAVVKLLVDVPLDGGDLFLLGGLEAEGCSKRFELESGGFIHLL